ncbi:MAG: hypothetical protein WKG07_38235 [Hymenobacter sp.]
MNDMDLTDSYLPQDKIFTADKKQYARLELKERARGMRHEPTRPKLRFRQLLRGNQLGVKFTASIASTATSWISCA